MAAICAGAMTFDALVVGIQVSIEMKLARDNWKKTGRKEQQADTCNRKMERAMGRGTLKVGYGKNTLREF
eukprot:10941623-Lingulodinium_polyedra.AAC.1